MILLADHILSLMMTEQQDKYEQIGDAVPPLLAYAWGIQIKNILGMN